MTGASRSARARRLRRAGAALGGAFALFVAAAGFLHTPVGRPLLAKLAGKGCPFGRGTLEPARREELRRFGLAKLVEADRPSPARTALGFELGSVRRDGVRAWAERHAVPCKEEARGSGLACEKVAGELLGENAGHDGSLVFRFDTRDRLVAILRMVRTNDVERAVRLVGSERAKLHERLGEPTRESGELSVASLERGPLRQARTEYRYRDFSAFASITNLGSRSYLVTEEAQLAD
ncbi:MAG TPA: hypothetical protein VF103_15700 [Polyangiaceae bacterium]